MKIGLVSLGCPKNLVDSEIMLGLAQGAGDELTEDAAQEARMSMIRLTGTTLLTGALLVLPLRASQGSEPDTVLRVYDRTTPGLVLPTVVKSGTPRYTAAAMHQRIRGIAVVDVTVGADGKVRDVLLAKSLDAVHGLDDEALAAAGRWIFSPGTLNGQPVPVRVQIDLAFALKEGRSPPGGERR